MEAFFGKNGEITTFFHRERSIPLDSLPSVLPTAARDQDDEAVHGVAFHPEGSILAACQGRDVLLLRSGS